MHYSGIVVQTRPGATAVCFAELEAVAGLEVHYRYPESGRLIVVSESATAAGQEELLRRIQGLPSVLTAALVEHVIDDSDGIGDSA